MNAINENNNNLTKLIQNIFCESALNTTLQPMPRISKINNHKLLRIFWVLCFLVCSCFCMYCCIQTLKNFYSYETSTRISTVSDAFPVFPAISLCNLNLLNFNFILNLTNNTNDFLFIINKTIKQL